MSLPSSTSTLRRAASAAAQEATIFTKPRRLTQPRRSARTHHAFFNTVYGHTFNDEEVRASGGVAPYGSLSRVRPRETEVSRGSHNLALYQNDFTQQAPTAADEVAAKVQMMLVAEEAEQEHSHRLAFHTGDDLAQGYPNEEMTYRAEQIREGATRRIQDESNRPWGNSSWESTQTGASSMFDNDFAQVEYPTEPSRWKGSSDDQSFGH